MRCKHAVSALKVFALFAAGLLLATVAAAEDTLTFHSVVLPALLGAVGHSNALVVARRVFKIAQCGEWRLCRSCVQPWPPMCRIGTSVRREHARSPWSRRGFLGTSCSRQQLMLGDGALSLDAIDKKGRRCGVESCA